MLAYVITWPLAAALRTDRNTSFRCCSVLGREAAPGSRAGMKQHFSMSLRQHRRYLLLLALVLMASSTRHAQPVAAYRQRRQSSLIAAAAPARDPSLSSSSSSSTGKATSASSSSSSSAGLPRQRPVHSPFNSEASMQIAARQKLFDYAVTEALGILDLAVRKIKIPEYKATIEIPVIGGIDVDISNVNITNLEVGGAVPD